MTSEPREAQMRREGVEDASSVIEWSARVLALLCLAGLLWAIWAAVAGVVDAVMRVIA